MNNKRQGRCVVITSHIESDENNPIERIAGLSPNDWIICADGGYSFAIRENIKPHAILGDFDSLNAPLPEAEAGTETGIEIIRLSPVKDYTDTLLCLERGLELGYREFFVVGGMGGRFDHTIGNLQAMSWCMDRGGQIIMGDFANTVFMTDGPEFTLAPREGCYFSVFSWTQRSLGVWIEGAQYCISDHEMIQSDPIGVSNEFIPGESVRIRVSQGRLLVVVSRK